MGGFGAKNIQIERRGAQVFDQIVKSGSLVIKHIGGARAGEIGAHRFFESADVTPGSISDHFTARTQEAVKGRRIVVAQDTTEINFSGRDKARKGLGPAGDGKALGFFIHPLIAIDIDSEALLGLAWTKIWTRSGLPAKDRRKRDFEDKESYRWLEATDAAAEQLAGAEQIVVVGDRESDIYPYFARRPAAVDLIVRAAQDRILSKEGRLFEAMENLEQLR